MNACPFCGPEEIPVAENDVALVIGDKHPISPGHSLVIPKRHVTAIFALSIEEYLGCFALVRSAWQLIESRYSPVGFHLLVNNGTAAGQTVEHAHIHVVPRYLGDSLKPASGLREFLPGPGSHS